MRYMYLLMPDGGRLSIPIRDDMPKNELLKALKIDLGIMATEYDERLEQYIEAAMIAITDEGVALDLRNIEHVQLVVMYAGWQWRKRDTGEGMPRMVRYQLNNLIIHQHIGEDDGRYSNVDTDGASS